MDGMKEVQQYAGIIEQYGKIRIGFMKKGVDMLTTFYFELKRHPKDSHPIWFACGLPNQHNPRVQALMTTSLRMIHGSDKDINDKPLFFILEKGKQEVYTADTLHFILEFDKLKKLKVDEPVKNQLIEVSASLVNGHLNYLNFIVEEAKMLGYLIAQKEGKSDFLEGYQ